VLVDANQHVDREAAARSGVGFYGKNTMLITRRFGSWVVL
jgi:epoxyqueuosine reductase QueG